jgi:16S rRNA U516 pseudouridylate synthase RsuA-like enzyme
VVDLERVRLGPLRLGSLAPGSHRRLRPDEVEALREAAAPPRA